MNTNQIFEWQTAWDSVETYLDYLNEEEHSPSTIKQYGRDIRVFLKWLDGNPLSKDKVMQYKKELQGRYRPTSVNVKLVALNGFFSYMECPWLRVRLLKIQRQTYCPEYRELSKDEYFELVKEAKRQGKKKLALILQTICSTGIRVSELKFITAEAVACGEACVHLKRKDRTIFIPQNLCTILKEYMKQEKIHSGSIFITRTHRPLDRSNICKQMKKLSKSAKIEPKKVYPHNLRHLFARCFYEKERDIAKLADILGHTSIDTTRIYIVSTGKEHRAQMEALGLV